MSEQLGLFGETGDQEAQKPLKLDSGPRVPVFAATLGGGPGLWCEWPTQCGHF